MNGWAARWVWGMTLANIGFFGVYSSLAIEGFATTYDFAGAEQGMWQLAFGQDQFNTVWGAHNFVNHVYGCQLLVAPLFRLFPSPHLLKWLQVLVVSAGAPVLYHLARDRTRNEPLAAVLGCLWLLSPVVTGLCAGEYFGVFPVGTLLLLLLANLSRGLARVAGLAMLTLACEESVAPTVFLLGLYTSWRIDRRAGVCLMALAAAWFGFIAFVLLPLLNEGYSTPHLAVYAIYGATPGEIVRTVFTRPGFVLQQMLVDHGGLSYLYQLSSISGFFSLLAPEVLAIDTLDFMAKLMTTYRGPHTFGRHYGLVSMPIVFWATAEGLARVQRLVERRAAGRTPSVDRVALHRVLASILIVFAVPGCLATGTSLRFALPNMVRTAQSAGAAAKRDLRGRIPAEARISASPDILLHLAHRPIAYSFPNPFLRTAWTGRPGDPDYAKYIIGADAQFHLDRGDDVDLIIISNSPTASPVMQSPGPLRDLVRLGKYRVQEETPHYVILERVAPAKRVAPGARGPVTHRYDSDSSWR